MPVENSVSCQKIQQFNSGVRPGNTLDNRLKLPNTNQPIRLNLTEQEKNALVAFLNTLSDPSLVTDEKFSDPFR